MRLIAVACLAAVVGCSGYSTDITPPTTTGSWRAVVAIGTSGDNFTIDIALTQSGTTISGTGTADHPNDPPQAILKVTGTATATAVSMSLQPQPQIFNGQTVDSNETPVTFTGTLSSTTMVGTISKAASNGNNGFTDVAATFTRQ